MIKKACVITETTCYSNDYDDNGLLPCEVLGERAEGESDSAWLTRATEIVANRGCDVNVDDRLLLS